MKALIKIIYNYELDQAVYFNIIKAIRKNIKLLFGEAENDLLPAVLFPKTPLVMMTIIIE